MEKKNAIIAAVVVVVIIVVAVAAYFAFSGTDDNDEDPTIEGTVTFLIQDDEGVYFWIEGMGATVMDAFEDAVEAFDIPFVASTDATTGESTGIQSLFGLEMTSDADGNWYWWSQYVWTGEAWESSSLYMSNLTPDDTNNYMAVVYGDGSIDVATLAAPADEAVWDGSTEGTVFTIQSSSGMYFQVNGVGETVMDAFEDAVEAFDIPFVASTDATTGESTGIQSLFGLEMTSDADGNWYWWSQYVMTDGGWESSWLYMNNLLSAENPVFYMIYGDGTVMP